MKLVFRNNYKIIIAFVLGLIISGFGVYAAILISSSDVTYNGTTAKAALDDLYTKVSTMYTKDEYDENYTRGKNSASLKQVGSWNNLTTGSPSSITINCSSYSNYQSLTADNFIVSMTAIKRWEDHNEEDHLSYISKSYNASTGVLTVSGLSKGFNGTWDGVGSAGVVYCLGCA